MKELKKICLEAGNETPMVTLWGFPPTYKFDPGKKEEMANNNGDSKTAKLNKLAQEVKVCQKCPLGKTRIQAVFGVGNPSARIIFIGEGPGYEEDRKGEPFVGKAGQLLDKILASINLARRPSPGVETIYIANVVKCHPMINPKQPDLRGNDRPPTQPEAMSCFPYLLRQIEIINPQIICTLGNAAAKVILGTNQGITSIRGQFFEFYHPQLNKNIQVLPTYHPAALLRNPNLKKDVWEDMKLLRKQLTVNS